MEQVPMKIIVAGGRDFDDYPRLSSVLLEFELAELEIVSGCARGADRLAILFAGYEGIPLKKFPADWVKHGKPAGFIRNGQMADYADTLVAFWDGMSKGTKHMIDLAIDAGLEVHVYRY